MIKHLIFELEGNLFLDIAGYHARVCNCHVSLQAYLDYEYDIGLSTRLPRYSRPSLYPTR